VDRIIKERLLKEARKAREGSYAPYSGFPVGAALLTREGRIFTGCNIENASYGLSICAERTAIFKAVSEGYRHFVALAVVADSSRAIPPCGACRQVLSEFGSDINIIMANLNGEIIEANSSDLLPGAFNRQDIGGD